MNFAGKFVFDEADLHYLRLLSKQYPNIAAASTEIINLQAILNLPKGTEHFISDVHGEHESFSHVLRNASGVIKRKIDDVFGNSLRESEKKSLATIIYYPEQKLEYILKEERDIEDWYRITLYRLIQICKVVSSKYTRSKVRKALPKDFGYIIEELIHEDSDVANKQHYYNNIIETIIKLDRSNAFIISISKLIQRLAIDRLHVIGDIYDRGPGADIILDTLMDYHSLDIQWGNHDIVWMGAAAGSEACICNAIRFSARYANLHIIEESYGINLLPLATFAMEYYDNDPCTNFMPKSIAAKELSQKESRLIAMMHKAITIIQFKLEGQIIKRHPEYDMDSRLLLDKIDYERGTICLNQKEYALNDRYFPTIDPANPYELTVEEKKLIDKLKSSFISSIKLQEHARFLFSKGSMYTVYNSNLLFHGCIPMDEGGNFKKIKIGGRAYSGKIFFDEAEILVRSGYFNNCVSEEKQDGMDFAWYLWCGPDSPLFGKKKMATFERYFIDNEETHIEEKNQYFYLKDDEEICNRILREFGLNPDNSHIINGHVPVKVRKGESPIKANGKLLDIDGGFSRAYQPETGIAGYTLIYNSYGLMLASHEPFESTIKAIEEEKDILSTNVILEQVFVRKTVGDTDIGAELRNQIKDLTMLLTAYRNGLIKEQE
ncbi:fructose-1,6-bisphosphatase [Clostridium thermarum]|uniref:fructose-1,6-bisphosphatase n=1 Tax=Clostridium thermarum TaxID=1716543 RepID=UPI0013D69863|nr:fructose-1,6-bisphosphatase [Clostridium thermarum]